MLSVGILFSGRYTQLYAVVYVNQIDPGSLHIVPPYHYERAFDARFPTTEVDATFLDQKIAEVAALYPAPEYIVDGGGWEEEIVYPYSKPAALPV